MNKDRDMQSLESYQGFIGFITKSVDIWDKGIEIGSEVHLRY